MRIRTFFVAVLAAVGLAMSPALALADGPAPPDGFSFICNGVNFGAPITGTPVEGHFTNLTLWGNSYVPNDATLTVSGNLVIAPGACLDAFSRGEVHVGKNISVGNGATLALGCAPFVNEAFEPCEHTTTNDTVGRNISADAPLTMYLTSVTVAGNVTSSGGGPGIQNPAISFPVKGMTIGGNLVLTGWHGAWIGALRNDVHGNVVIAANVGSRTGPTGEPDSTEVVSNTVGRNLICQGNTPAASFGDALENPANGTGFNSVGGHAIGECRSLAS